MSEYFINGRWRHAMEDTTEDYADYLWEKWVEEQMKKEDLK